MLSKCCSLLLLSSRTAIIVFGRSSVFELPKLSEVLEMLFWLRTKNDVLLLARVLSLTSTFISVKFSVLFTTTWNEIKGLIYAHFKVSILVRIKSFVNSPVLGCSKQFSSHTSCPGFQLPPCFLAHLSPILSC